MGLLLFTECLHPFSGNFSLLLGELPWFWLHWQPQPLLRKLIFSSLALEANRIDAHFFHPTLPSFVIGVDIDQGFTFIEVYDGFLFP